MDQNSSNGSGKSNWREKLGIGPNVKDKPKLSQDIKASGDPAKAAPQAEPKLDVKPPVAGAAPRAPQAVAKPAPMAPRAAPRPAGAVSQQQARTVRPQSETSENPLAEKLRAQRQAAERAAEQRILQARERALDVETKGPARAGPAGEKPKFTFAEEELVQAKREVAPADAQPEVSEAPPPPPPPTREYTPVFQQQQRPAGPQQMVPPLVPPRQPLGGERAIAGQVPPRPRQPPVGYQPQFTNPPQPQAYRPLDPPGFKRAQQAGLARPGGPAPRYPDRPGTDPRLAAQREAYEAYRRGMLQPPTADDDAALFEEAPRRPRPAAARPRPGEPDDFEGVFDDQAPPPPRRRASAQEYNQAYREFEEEYGQERHRRSRGPWILLGLLLAAIIASGAGVYFYYKNFRTTPVAGQSTTGDAIPVVPAPETPAKAAGTDAAATAPEAEPAQPAQPDQKKQIYDRIVGEQEIQGNTIVPTVEQPVQPEAPAEQPAAAQPAAEPAPLPAPPAAEQPAAAPAGGEGNSTEPLPLPLPPAPGENGAPAPDTQGSLPNSTTQQTVAAASGATNIEQAPSVTPAAAPIPDAPVPGSGADDTAADAVPVKPLAAEVEEPEQPQAEKPKPAKKAVEKKPPAKKPKKEEETAALGTEPVVLVPPESSTTAAAPAPTQPEVQPVEEQGSGSFFNFGNRSGESVTKKIKGKSAEGPSTSANAKAAPSSEDAAQDAGNQVAAIEPPQAAAVPEPEPLPVPEAQPEQQASAPATGGGYVAQLASFRSEAEALAEFKRLKAKHPQVLGNMSSRVTKGSSGGITRYRLGVGPMSDKASADNVCDRLIAAGERDCLAKRL
jgi:cell division septation protein DedD